MDSLYVRDPNGFLIELAVYRFVPPAGRTTVEVLTLAHRLRVEQGAHAIAEPHVREAGGWPGWAERSEEDGAGAGGEGAGAVDVSGAEGGGLADAP